ncbi:MAG: transaldolase family protein [Cyanobacteriota bacterium]|nr:transaldolase family protein [Cyanobacteriota bacterium]
MSLRLLLDSADTEIWEELWPLGLFRGITTNPSLLRRSGRSCDMDGLGALVMVAREMGCTELHLQAWGTTDSELLACGRSLLALGPREVVVKLPLTEPGLRAARVLREAGERVTLTACHATPQVIAAAALGVTYVAPYLGRISDGGRDGAAEVRSMGRCLRGLGSSTRLLVASLRSLAELTSLAADGVDTFTLSPPLARQLWTHAATAEAVSRFEADALGQIPARS